MPTQHKATRTSAISLQIKLKFILIQFWHIWIILCHHLVCFCKSNSNLLSLSQTHMLKHKESHFRRDWSKISKTPPFSHNQHFSPQEANFWQKRQCKSFDKPKALSYCFQSFSSGSWSIYCFGLYFLPLWHQAPKRDQSWPFNPIASPKSSIKSKWQ